ncbi:nucleotidyltransferase family protein [uncultured Rothia sp.]|uniref:nucleotidyltransferase family protein n=1 Tax=uncultured Rothia sp. TaxID=316088 RepID=UPI00321680B5
MEETLDTPLKARILLSHAYFQHFAENNAIDVLHIKGYAFGSDTYPPQRSSSDADLLVRPAHVNRLMYLLVKDGWEILTHFNTGSIFEHAATIYHPYWGLADIHKYFPGIGFANPSLAFDQLWAQRRVKTIARFPCTVPSLIDSRILVIVHGARSFAQPHPDTQYLIDQLSTEEWDNLRRRARELHAEIAFDTALGNLEQHRGHPHYLMWKVISQQVPFYVEWWARFLRAHGTSEKMRVLWQIASVNEDHLAMSLGHPPTRQEKRQQLFERFERILPWKP